MKLYEIDPEHEEELIYKELVLQKTYLDGAWLVDRAKIRCFQRWDLAYALHYQIVSYVLTMDEMYHEYPADWWEAIKARVQEIIPGFFERNPEWKPRMKKVKIYGKVCPHLSTDRSDLHFRFFCGLPDKKEVRDADDA